jgi:hypothetical protein
MKELGLQELLRYALSGGIGIAVLLLTHPAILCSIVKMEAAKGATLVLGLVLLIGTLIYNLHRALIYPLFFRIVGLMVMGRNFSRRSPNPWQPSEAELEVDRWRRRLPDEERRPWDEWGAQTHFLYCAAWAILAALLLGKHLWGTSDSGSWCIFWILFVIVIIAGFVNNYRLLYSLVVDKTASENLWKSN